MLKEFEGVDALIIQFHAESAKEEGMVFQYMSPTQDFVVMDDRLALNVAKVGDMSKELKTILYKDFRKKFSVKPHVTVCRAGPPIAYDTGSTKPNPYVGTINLSAEELSFYLLCAKAFLILSGKNPMNYSIWYDLLNLNFPN
jgi:hypothetical protein